jgi:hypothetical protein
MRPRKTFSPLDPECSLCNPSQLLQCQFDPQVQLLQLKVGKLTTTYQVHAHGVGLFLVAYKRPGSEKLEVADGLTTINALERALRRLKPAQ